MNNPIISSFSVDKACWTHAKVTSVDNKTLFNIFHEDKIEELNDITEETRQFNKSQHQKQITMT